MLTWEDFWYTQSVLITSIASFFIFRTFLAFPWSWMPTILLQHQFSINQNIFIPSFFSILVLSFFEMLCKSLELKWVAFVAAGIDAIPIVFAYLGCILNGYAHERLLSNSITKNMIGFVWVHFFLMWLGFSLEDYDEEWYYEILISAISGTVLLQYAIIYRVLYLMLVVRREMAEIRRRMDQIRAIRQLIAQADHNAQA